MNAPASPREGQSELTREESCWTCGAWEDEPCPRNTCSYVPHSKRPEPVYPPAASTQEVGEKLLRDLNALVSETPETPAGYVMVRTEVVQFAKDVCNRVIAKVEGTAADGRTMRSKETYRLCKELKAMLSASPTPDRQKDGIREGELIEALREIVRIDDESGLYANPGSVSELVIALHDARALLARVREK